MESRFAAKFFSLLERGKRKKEGNNEPHREMLDPSKQEELMSRCRDEAKISEENVKGNWTCGALCGKGKYNGFALYPQRFSVNIT